MKEIVFRDDGVGVRNAGDHAGAIIRGMRRNIKKEEGGAIGNLRYWLNKFSAERRKR